MEAELVHEKTDAAVMVADEDVDALDAEMRLLWSGGSGGGGHGKIIRRVVSRRGLALNFTSWPPFSIWPHDILRDKQLNDTFFHAASKVNTLRIEIIVSAELKLAILFDLYMDYGSRNGSTNSSHDFLPHGWLKGNYCKI